MKNTNKKKIIIGYRYDPQTNSSQRLHQIHAVTQNPILFSTNNSNSVNQSSNYLQAIRLLQNQNLLLKAQLQRIQQKSSYRSYQILYQTYNNLQVQYKKLKYEVQNVKSQILILQQKCKSLEKQKSTKNNSQIQHQDGRKYTFSPYHHNYNGQDQFMQKQQLSIKRTSSLNQSVIKNIYLPKPQQTGLQSQKSIKTIKSQRTLQMPTFNDPPYQFMNGINSQYLYNNLRTIESQKSQQMQSQLVLDVNFSFMPKPLRKNQQSLKILPSPTKKVSFRQETQNLYSEQDLISMNKIVDSKKQLIQMNVQTNFKDKNQLTKNVLSGLKKLPEKAIRIQTTSSNQYQFQ